MRVPSFVTHILIPFYRKASRNRLRGSKPDSGYTTTSVRAGQRARCFSFHVHLAKKPKNRPLNKRFTYCVLPEYFEKPLPRHEVHVKAYCMKLFNSENEKVFPNFLTTPLKNSFFGNDWNSFCHSSRPRQHNVQAWLSAVQELDIGPNTMSLCVPIPAECGFDRILLGKHPEL